MSKIFKVLDNRGQLFWSVTGTTLVGLLGVADYLTGYELSFSLFYLAPIALVTWYANQRLGLFISVLSAVTWLIADVTSGQTYSHPIIYIWNTLIRFGFFIITCDLLTQLRRSQEAEQAAARTDYVSGVMNARYFHEALEMELERSRRYPHPSSLVYMDIDDFKVINDRNGHAAGDEVIHFVASELKRQLRNTDIIARIGGDEFGLLLPFCGGPESKIVISRLHAKLTAEMRKKNWPITFSMGVVICEAVPRSAYELMRMADELMYSVKHSTKNDVRFLPYTGKPLNQTDNARTNVDG